MKKWKTGLIFVLLGVLLFLMVGCKAATDAISEALDEPQNRQKTEAMLDCLLTDDMEGAAALFQGIDLGASFQSDFDQLKGMLHGVADYTLEAYHVTKNVTNGVSSQSIRYLLTAGELRLWVDTVETEGYEGLTGFHLTPVTISNGTLDSMENTNAVQWVFLIIGMLEIAFVLWMLIDCCCRRISKKWLWILAILLGSITWILTLTPQRIHLNLNYGLFFSYTALIGYSTGGFALRVYLPVGAVVYLCLRKTLLKKPREAEALKGPGQAVLPSETSEKEVDGQTMQTPQQQEED